jgi:hypothetical protein
MGDGETAMTKPLPPAEVGLRRAIEEAVSATSLVITDLEVLASTVWNRRHRNVLESFVRRLEAMVAVLDAEMHADPIDSALARHGGRGLRLVAIGLAGVAGALNVSGNVAQISDTVSRLTHHADVIDVHCDAFERAPATASTPIVVEAKAHADWGPMEANVGADVQGGFTFPGKFAGTLGNGRKPARLDEMRLDDPNTTLG